MSSRHRRRTQNQVVARGAADRQRVVGVEVNGAPRGLLVAQHQHDAVVMARCNVADDCDIARREGRRGRLDAVDVDAVGRAVILDVAHTALQQKRTVQG